MDFLVSRSNSHGIIELSPLWSLYSPSDVCPLVSVSFSALYQLLSAWLHQVSPCTCAVQPLAKVLWVAHLDFWGPLLGALSSPVFVLQFPAASSALNCNLCLLSTAQLLFYVSPPCAAGRKWSLGWHSGLILVHLGITFLCFLLSSVWNHHFIYFVQFYSCYSVMCRRLNVVEVLFWTLFLRLLVLKLKLASDASGGLVYTETLRPHPLAFLIQ